ncbi:MAG: three-Cys-motif partner protein TcmP [Nocardioides sp.]
MPWPCAEHTGAKHDIYRRYLRRWFPILLAGSNAFPSVTYAEGFAGPGVYTAGESGSPVIAMQALMDEVRPDKGVARFVFVDDDPRCVEMLPVELRKAFPQRPRDSETMPVEIIKGTCAEELESALDRIGAWGQPVFANLDSWGNAPVPFRLLQRIASNVSSEVIVTLLPQHFIRFVSDLGPAADDVFGGDAKWRTVTDLEPAAKSRHILTRYRAALHAAGFEFLLDFELVPRNGQSLYLLFATGHRRGLEKMKDSLWEVDSTEGVGFRDPRDEQEEALFVLDEPQLGPLTRLLERKLMASDRMQVHELREAALFETVYRPEHVIAALKPLVEAGRVKVNPPGRLRRASFVELSSPPAAP